jgi:hypothetical protein
VAATVERMETDAPVNEHHRGTITAGTVVIVTRHTTSWAPLPQLKPTHRPLVSRIPVDIWS